LLVAVGVAVDGMVEAEVLEVYEALLQQLVVGAH